MKNDELIRALDEDRTVTPSREFRFRVLYAVRQETSARDAIPFPWRRLLVALGASIVLTAVAILAIDLGDARPPAGLEALVGFGQRLAPAAALMAIGLVASLLTIVVTLRWSER